MYSYIYIYSNGNKKFVEAVEAYYDLHPSFFEKAQTLSDRNNQSRIESSSNTPNIENISTIEISPNIRRMTNPGVTNSGMTTPDIINPNIRRMTNPGKINPDIRRMTTSDMTNPGVTDPGITNPEMIYPDVRRMTNPDMANPDMTNPDMTNPGMTNPGVTNPGVTNPGMINQTDGSNSPLPPIIRLKPSKSPQ
jgi:hypothetical protein